jgi:hypothetical protein
VDTAGFGQSEGSAISRFKGASAEMQRGHVELDLEGKSGKLSTRTL